MFFLYAASSASSRAWDEGLAVDPLLLLDHAYRLDDLRAHRRSFLDQVASHDRVVRDLHRLALARVHLKRPLAGADELATDLLLVGCADGDCPADGALEVRAAPERRLGAGRRDVDRVLAQVVAEDFRDALAESVVDSLRMVDEDRHPLGAGELEREDLDSGQAALDARGDLAVEAPLLVIEIRQLCSSQKKRARRAHFKLPEMWWRQG